MKLTALTDFGHPIVGACLYIRDREGVALNAYADERKTMVLPSPLVAGANGQFTEFFLPAATQRLELFDGEVRLWETDATFPPFA